MDPSLYLEMFNLEEKHWWFRAKRKIVFTILNNLFKNRKHSENKIRISDIGCGCGINLVRLNQIGFDATGIDYNDHALSYCQQRGVNAIKGSITEGLDIETNSYDACLMLDVLEHVSDEKVAIKEALRIVRPDGYIIAAVPAYQWLWTKRDEHHHHKRRYTKKTLLKCISANTNAKVTIASYYNSFLFPIAVIARLLSKIKNSRKTTNDLKVPSGFLNEILFNIFSLERFHLTKGFSFPFGLSILVVIKKCEENKQIKLQ